MGAMRWKKKCGLERILRWYELASGQKINLEKSVITLNPSTGGSTTQAILQILELGSVQSKDQYLGLLTAFNKNKCEAFEHIIERVRMRLKVGDEDSFQLEVERLISKQSCKPFLPTS
ncbi:hypothetical protein TorRG33x02_157520 [Trema orientale]|uniref:Uncharacterized protein n=1 Tax=Trema orientale TaxID=63057 RepID=A0A2P5ES82_TREOI|nr:hypothetical protein TorRG33x02_157520 [Trema orientale]